jgi:hypothetical protein
MIFIGMTVSDIVKNECLELSFYSLINFAFQLKKNLSIEKTPPRFVHVAFFGSKLQTW